MIKRIFGIILILFYFFCVISGSTNPYNKGSFLFVLILISIIFLIPGVLLTYFGFRSLKHNRLITQVPISSNEFVKPIPSGSSKNLADNVLKTKNDSAKERKGIETNEFQKVEKALISLKEAFAFKKVRYTMDELRTLEEHQQLVARNLDAAVAESGDAGIAALLRFVNNGLSNADHMPTAEAIRALGRANAMQAVPVLLSLVSSSAKKELKIAAGDALSMLQGGQNPWSLLQQAEKIRAKDGDERLRLLDQIDSQSFDRLNAQEKYYVWYLRAMVYKGRGDRDRAIDCFKTGLRYFKSPLALAWKELKDLENS